MFPVRYELNVYIIFRRNFVFKGLSNLKMGNPGVAYRCLELRRRGFRGEFLLCSSIRIVDILSLSRIDSYSLCDSCGDIVSKWNPQIGVTSLLGSDLNECALGCQSGVT
jgi:hypothetical protein